MIRNYIMAKNKTLLSLNVQHEYITLRTPNGNFTTSYRGSKASGKLAVHPTAFKELDNYIHKGFDANVTFGERMNTLLEPKVLERFFPEWNNALPELQIGDTIKLTDAFAKKYPHSGVIKKITRKTAYVKFPNADSLIGFDMAFMEKV